MPRPVCAIVPDPPRHPCEGWRSGRCRGTLGVARVAGTVARRRLL